MSSRQANNHNYGTFNARSVLKVREGEEDVRARVCTEAMDFMEGMRDGWNGLLPPVAPNVVSFNIIVKVSMGVLGGKVGIYPAVVFERCLSFLTNGSGLNCFRSRFFCFLARPHRRAVCVSLLC